MDLLGKHDFLYRRRLSAVIIFIVGRVVNSVSFPIIEIPPDGFFICAPLRRQDQTGAR